MDNSYMTVIGAWDDGSPVLWGPWPERDEVAARIARDWPERLGKSRNTIATLMAAAARGDEIVAVDLSDPADFQRVRAFLTRSCDCDSYEECNGDCCGPGMCSCSVPEEPQA